MKAGAESASETRGEADDERADEKESAMGALKQVWVRQVKTEDGEEPQQQRNGLRGEARDAVCNTVPCGRESSTSGSEPDPCSAQACDRE